MASTQNAVENQEVITGQSVEGFIHDIHEAIATQDKEKTISLCDQLAASFPYNANAQNFAGTKCFEMDAYGKSISYMVAALKLKPSMHQAQEYLSYALWLVEKEDLAHVINDDLIVIFGAMLKEPRDLNIDLLVRAWCKIIHQNVFFKKIIIDAPTADAAEFSSFFNALDAKTIENLCCGFICNGLALHILPDVKIEAFFTAMRRYVLLNANASKNSEQKLSYQKLLHALAQSAYNSDYIYSVAAAEEDALDALREEISNAKKLDVFDICLYGCYTPLYTNENIVKALGKKLFSPVKNKDSIADLIQQQITEPLCEQSLRSAVRTISKVEDETSKEVRAQYEENPYPRWRKLRGVHQDNLADKITALNLPQPEILIAGSATGGYSMNIALARPNAKITGVDLSLTSISYATRKAQEHKIKNVEFVQGDILDIANINKTFDIIESVGVIHHMKEPEKGLQALLSALKDDGFLKLGLYSVSARKHITACQNDLAERGFGSSAQGIRNGREYILSLGADHEYAKMYAYNDFYNVSMVRDMLFHVQEHCYTIPQIKKMLSDHNLEFMGFTDLNAGNVLEDYANRFPDDSDKLDLDNWAVFEQEQPDTFIGMYRFWCRKV